MDLTWEERRVSTPGRIFDKIKTEMAQPVGVVVVGVDGKLKSEVVNLMMREMGGISHFYVRTPIPDLTELSKAFRRKPIVTVVLGTAESGMHYQRCELIELMREAGAQTMVEIYTKARRVPVRPLMSSADKAQFNRAVATIEAHEPTAEEVKYFFLVEEKEE